MGRFHKVVLVPLFEGGGSRKISVSSGQLHNTQKTLSRVVSQPRVLPNASLRQLHSAQKVQATRTVSLSRVVNNTLISLLGQAITWTSTLLLTIAYGRFLGDVKLGELYFALTFVLLIGFPLEFGFNQQLARDVAQEPTNVLRYLSNILLIKAVLWVALYGALLFICRLLGYSQEEYNLVVICGITLLSTSIASTFASSHYAFERAVFPVIGSILEKALTALFGFILLSNGAGVQTMALVLLGGSLANAIWQASWFFRLTGLPLLIDLPLIRTLMYTSVPFLIYGALSVIYYRLDTVLLSLMASTAAIGWYGAGYRIFDTFYFLPSIVINAIMYPVFSKLSVTSPSTLKTAFEKSLNLLIFSSFPIATIMVVDADSIINLLYHNPEFIHTVPSFQNLAPGLVFIYINSVFSSVLVSTKQEKKITVMATIALVFNLGLNMILIPQYQHIGAAIATSLTEILLFGLALMFIPRYLLPLGSISVGTKALIASLVMALITWELRAYSIFITLPIAMLVYLVVATLLRTIPREDIQALYRAVRNKAQKGSAASSVEETTRDLQTTLELAVLHSGEIPAVPTYQMLIERQTTLKLEALGDKRR